MTQGTTDREFGATRYLAKETIEGDPKGRNDLILGAAKSVLAEFDKSGLELNHRFKLGFHEFSPFGHRAYVFYAHQPAVKDIGTARDV